MKLHQRGVTASAPLEYLPCAADAVFEAGQLLKVEAGAALCVTGTAAPTYLCAGSAKNGGVPAVRIQPDMTFEARLSEDGAALKIGDRVTIGDDAQTVTATTGGAAEITGFPGEGRAAGDSLYCKL